jgi:hypothetical protein
VAEQNWKMGRLLFGAGNKASAKGGKRTGGFTKNSAKTAKKLQTLQTLVQTVQHEVDSGSTHLYAAARRGDGARVQELIEAGSSVNEATTSGRTPLHVAAQNGHLTVVMKPTKRTKMHNSLTEAEISAIVDADAGIYFGDEVWPGDEEDQMPELMSQSSDDDWYQKILSRRMTPREAEISAIVEATLARLEAGSSSDEDDERYWYRDEDNEAPPTKLRKRRKLHDSASASHDGAAEDTRSRIVQVLPAIAGEEEYMTLRADGIARVETAEALELWGELPHAWTAWGAPRYCAGKN